MLEEFKSKYELSFLNKLKDNSEINIFIFGGAIRDIKLGREWKEIDLRITYDRPRKEREDKIEDLLKEYNLKGKTQIENLNLTVYRFLPDGSWTNVPIDLSFVTTRNYNVPDFTINALIYDPKGEEILDGSSDKDD